MTRAHVASGEVAQIGRPLRSVLAAVAAAALAFLGAAPASAISDPVLYATHPSIMAKPDSAHSIEDLAVFDGKLWAGYGDWTNNTGVVDLAFVDLATGTPGVAGRAPTEAINVWRMIGGQLAAPWVDPTAWGGATPPNGGYSISGPWRDVHTFPASHVFDIARTPDGSLWTSGAGAYEADGAVIYRSTDNGATWRLSLAEASPGGITGYERFYWMGVIGGKLYAQAAHVGTDMNALFPMRVWDGTRWTKARDRASLGMITQAADVEPFAGRLWSTRFVTDGKRATPNGSPVTLADLFVSGSRLYGISYNGTVVYTTGGAWTVLPGLAVPAGESARSIAVSGSSVYVGTRVGTIFRSTL